MARNRTDNDTGCLLRVRGLFRWPPVKGAHTQDNVSGRLEIRYRLTSGATYSGYLCWIPSSTEDAAEPSDPQDSNPSTWTKDAAFSYWLSTLKNVGVEFCGGSLVERFTFNGRLERAEGLSRSECTPLHEEFQPTQKASRFHFVEQRGVHSLAADLLLPRFGKINENVLYAQLLIPLKGKKEDINDSFSHTIKTSTKNFGFVKGQAAELLKALGVSRIDSTRLSNSRLTATVHETGMVFRLDNVPPALFPRSADSNGMVCSKTPSGARKLRAIIAHTSARHLWVDAGWRPLAVEAHVEWEGLPPDASPTAELNPKSQRASVRVVVQWPMVQKRAFEDAFPCVTVLQLLEMAIDDSRKAIDSLRRVAGGQPETFLPDLTLKPIPGSLRFAAHPRDAVNASYTSETGIVLNESPLDRATRFTVRKGPKVRAAMSVPFFQEDAIARPLEVSLCDALAEDPADDRRREGSEWIAGFDVVTASVSSVASGRLGSLRLKLGTLPNGKLIGRIVIRTPKTMQTAEGNGDGNVRRLQCEFRFGLPVDAVEPVGVDIPWGDREIDELPLFVRNGDGGANTALFTLNLVEAIGPDIDRHLTAELTTNKVRSARRVAIHSAVRSTPHPSTLPFRDGGALGESYTLLATQPFGVARFTRRPLADSGDAELAIVAAFDSDTRTWLFKRLSEEYRYDFPPQGIGEGADKPGRWEIYDLSVHGPGEGDIQYNDADDTVAFVRPRPGRRSNASYIVDCRFSPSTTLWVRPSDLERNFVLPEWAAHEIFRQHNDFGIGAALTALRGEFLYGLAVAISTRKETGPSRAARIAEIEALTGRLPAISHTGTPDSELLRRWGSLRRALKTRHERLEIWTPAPTSPSPFGAARFTDGVSYALRLNTASLRPPVASEADSSDQSGLPGGALWPIESKLFYDAILANPRSGGGTIERIALSPTGGDADLRAEFLGGTVAIVAEVRNGFVQRQRVEIIGRVCTFWNTSKHVVVYERTVNPSAQFTPEWDEEDNPGWSRYRSRRPILRKVREFVEVTESVRKFPDLGRTDVTSCGFLDSIRFNSRTINVDSAWAVDVLDDNGNPRGYAIPLWNRGAALRRPQVYPEPDVAFVTIGEGKEDRPLVAQGCLDTDNLWFYAEPTPGGNPDTWLDVFGFDWGNVLPPSVIDEKMTPGGGSHSAPDGGRKAPVPRTMPGYRRFTWRLARADAKTAVNAGFGAKPVYVGLDSVTFSRRMPSKPESLSTNAKFGRLAGSFANAGSFLSRLEVAVNANAPAGDITNLIKDFPKSTFWEEAKDLAVNKVAALTMPWNADQIRQKLVALVVGKGRLLTMSVREIVLDQCDAIDAHAREVATQFAKEWNATDADLRGRYIRAFAAMSPFSDTINEVVVGELNADGSNDDLVNEIEKAKATLHGVLDAWRGILGEFRGRIEAVRSSFQSTAVWSAQRAATFAQQVNEIIASAPSRLQVEVDEAQHRFAAELGPLSVPAIKGATDLFKPVVSALVDLLKNIPSLTSVALWDDCVIGVDVILKEIAEQAASLEEKRKDIDLQVGEVFGPLMSLVGQSGTDLRKAASDILREDIFARWLAEAITDDDIRLTSGVVPQNNFRDAIENLENILKRHATKIRRQVDRLTQSILAAMDESKLSGLPSMQLKASKLVEGIQAKWTTVADFFEQPAKWQDLQDRLEELRNTPANGQEWLGLHRVDARQEIAEATSVWHSYSGVVSEKLMAFREGGIAAGPGNALRLLSAATTAPEIGVLQGNIDRVRCSYDEAKVGITKAKASLNRLGDALKAMGIDIPFDGIGDTLSIPEGELANLNLAKLFPNFGGLDLSNLLGDVKLPPGVKDCVRITHDFDRKALRAWVQVDVEVPVSGSRELYAVGPFSLNLRDSVLTGRLRAEVSQDDDAVRDTGTGEIATNIDVIVGGAVLLSLEKVRITYTGTEGLKFNFDPKRIRLHPSMQFVQDTFGDLFADEIGGLTILKEAGVPVGVEHLFSLPTISLMSGTTGVANIQLGNAFRLRAYPEFVIANRFNLSRREAPFLFTFFILGGTGFAFVDTSYSPLTKQLVVTVEAAVGGVAALGFSYGPVNGSVCIALLVGLTYRSVSKAGKSSGEGLAVNVILLISGLVSLWGIVDISLTILLVITYGDGGRIYGVGTLSVVVKVSMFLTLTYFTEVKYMLRDGGSTSTEKSRMTERSKSLLNAEDLSSLRRSLINRQRLEAARA